ncbi:MAG: hypothetical protein HPY70_06110 [Firmicutes bacterium]|jgi:sulfur carrier protein ThiS|nr:hypothetical protein [Bacillota bacterium]
MATIRLNLNLIDIVKKKEIKINVEQPTALKDILKNTGINEEDIGLVIKNGKWAPIECKVSRDDLIELFPYQSGG